MIQKLFCQPYIIVGMHRSGTSMLSGLLHDAGIFMGNDWGRNRESMFFQAINIRLMRESGFDWATPGVPDPSARIRIHSWKLCRHYLKAHRHPRQLLQLLSGGAWGWKDPRNTYTLGSWLKIFPRAKVIHIYRNGMDVALSLHQRNIKLGPESQWYEKALENKTGGLDLWEKYTAQALAHQARLGDQMLTLQFEKLVAGDDDEVRRLEQFTGLALRRRIAETADQGRTARYAQEGNQELIRYAAQNPLMNRLGYCGDPIPQPRKRQPSADSPAFDGQTLVASPMPA